MNTLTTYIESGILELYVLGAASPEEALEVEKMSALHEEVRQAISDISDALLTYAAAQAEAPHATVRPMLLATIDYTERLKNGEPAAFPPILGENARIDDYAEWLNRPDMVAPADFDNIFVKLIGYTPQVASAIVWIKEMAPDETHHDEHERFLIIEGTCDIVIGDEVHKMGPGSYMQIPLHSTHYVKVTSDIPCKVILQRVAA